MDKYDKMKSNGIDRSPNGPRYTHQDQNPNPNYQNGMNGNNINGINIPASSNKQGYSQTATTNFYNGKKKNRGNAIHENESNKLKAIINKLERKAEDRKISLKQLYTILT